MLAGELALADGDVAAAFLGYERRLRQFLVTKQDAALRFAGYFAPKSWLGLIFRDVVSNIASVPVLARLMFARTFRENLQLPNYGSILRLSGPHLRDRGKPLRQNLG